MYTTSFLLLAAQAVLTEASNCSSQMASLSLPQHSLQATTPF